MSECMVIVERLADGILGVKHGVATFVIQYLECYYNNGATRCCRPLSSGRGNFSSIRDSNEKRIWQLRISGSIECSYKNKNIPGI